MVALPKCQSCRLEIRRERSLALDETGCESPRHPHDLVDASELDESLPAGQESFDGVGRRRFRGESDLLALLPQRSQEDVNAQADALATLQCGGE